MRRLSSFALPLSFQIEVARGTVAEGLVKVSTSVGSVMVRVRELGVDLTDPDGKEDREQMIVLFESRWRQELILDKDYKFVSTQKLKP